MAYNKHTWTTQELITSDKLNNIEDGIKNFEKGTPSIKEGTYSLSLNKNRIVNLSNLLTYNLAQEILTNPNNGYRYVFWHVTGTTKETEDMVIVELDQFKRIRSTMKVLHGVNKTSWLHGQFCQFNYYNTDNSKVEFLVGGPGELIKLEYQPNKTVNYDDLDVFLTVDEKNSYPQAIDFENNKVISAYATTPQSGQYTYHFSKYNLEPTTGKTTKIKDFQYTVPSPKPYISQGYSAAPASSYLNQETDDTFIFCTHGVTNGNTPGDYSFTIFRLSDDEISLYAKIEDLDNAAYHSTSNSTSYVDFISDRIENGNEYKVSYIEIEGSSQTKVNGKWVFTTNVVYANDSNTFNGGSYQQRSMSQVQIAFGGSDEINELKSIGYPSQNKNYNMESTTTKLYDIIQEGVYNISPTLLTSLTDIPYVFKLGDLTANIDGTGKGVETIEFKVKPIGVYGRVKQILTISTNLGVNHVFHRLVIPTINFGQPTTYDVKRWVYEKQPNPLSFSPFTLMNRSSNNLLPGHSRYITGGFVNDFFEGATGAPTASGLFEVLYYQIPLENSNTVTRIMQRFTTWSSPHTIYERVVTVKPTTTSAPFTQDIGGGYPATGATYTAWTKIN